MLRFLYHVGQAVAKQGLGEVVKAIADPSLVSADNLIGRIGADVLKGYRDDRKQDKLNADIVEAAKVAFAEVARNASVIALKVAPNDPALRGHIERFVTLVPACIRATLKRPDDPTGTTLPHNYRIEDESDIVKMLPARFPREHFKPGFAPPFLRGWELVEQIGAGGFGEVWKVCNAETRNLIGAVKISHELNDAELSLLNEGDVLNRLLAYGQHPGIVAIQDNSLRRPKGWSADVPHLPWIRYEYVAGGDLTQLIHRWAALPMDQRVPKVLAAFRELCETVGHFHRLSPGIIHRDLKPSNILVTADGKLKIGDFGIGSVSAKRVLDGERRGTLSRTNTVQAYLRGAHTPLYAPPEQKSDPKHKPAPTDDVHALGVILYQMLTGRLDVAPGARFDRELGLLKVPDPVIELIGDCVDERAKRPADGVAIGRELTIEFVATFPVATPVVAPVVKPERARIKKPAEESSELYDTEIIGPGRRRKDSDKTFKTIACDSLVEKQKVELEGKQLPTQEQPPSDQSAVQRQDRRHQPLGVIPTTPVDSEDDGIRKLFVTLAAYAKRSITLVAVFPIALTLLVLMLYFVFSKRTRETSLDRSGATPHQETLKKPDAINLSGSRPGQEMTLSLGDCGVKMTFCWCPPGNFQRGSTDYDNEKPVSEISISKGFWMAKYETTQMQWEALGFKNESQFTGNTLPVGNVSHIDAVTFAEKLKQLSGTAIRLPTEAEWEYACSAGVNTKYHSGNTEADLDQVGWYDKNSGRETHPVGQKKANNWGLHDMHGNVWEWCADWYDEKYYATSPMTDPECKEGKQKSRVLRGGSSDDYALFCTVSYRSGNDPLFQHKFNGFRLVLPGSD